MSDKQEDQTSAEDQEDRRYCVDEDTAVSRFRHGTIHSCGTGKAAGACEGTEGTAGISEEAARSFRRLCPVSCGLCAPFLDDKLPSKWASSEAQWETPLDLPDDRCDIERVDGRTLTAEEFASKYVNHK